MNINITELRLRAVNYIIVSYFIVLYLLNAYQVQNNFIDALRELFTIPFLLAKVVFLILSVVLIRRHGYRRPGTIISFIALLACAIATIGSFF